MLISGLSISSAPTLAHSSTGSMTMSMSEQEVGSLVESNKNQGEISQNDGMSCEDLCASTPCPASSCSGKIITVLPSYSASSFSFISQLAFADQIEYATQFASIFHPPKY